MIDNKAALTALVVAGLDALLSQTSLALHEDLPRWHKWTTDGAQVAIDMLRNGKEMADIVDAALEYIDAMPSHKVGEWIAHNGNGVCPIADGITHIVRFRDGVESTPDYQASTWNWSWIDADYNIVAFKILEN